METQLTSISQSFNWICDNEKNVVRVQGSFENPMFCVKDVCAVLSINNTSDVVRRLEPEMKGLDSIETLGGSQKTTFCNEEGLYEIIFTSNKPIAKSFRRWVFKEVLPSIRRQGSYSTIQQLETDLVAEKKKRKLLHNAERIGVQQRIKDLRYLNDTQVSNIHSSQESWVADIGHLVKMSHPDKGKYMGHILAISNRLSKASQVQHGKYPDAVNGSKRANVYSSRDFGIFGDAIIRAYMVETGGPDNWEIDFDFGFNRRQRLLP